MRMDVQVKFNYFPTIPKTVRADLSRVVRSTTLRVEGRAKTKSRVDTGQMMGGWQSIFPDDLTGVVFNPVAHTIHNEFGTKRMSAKPMIRPAIEEERGHFVGECTDVLKRAGR